MLTIFQYLNITTLYPYILFEVSWSAIGAPNIMFHYLDIQLVLRMSYYSNLLFMGFWQFPISYSWFSKDAPNILFWIGAPNVIFLVTGYSSGAPDSQCGSLTPGHGFDSKDLLFAPFQIKVTKNWFNCSISLYKFNFRIGQWKKAFVLGNMRKIHLCLNKMIYSDCKMNNFLLKKIINGQNNWRPDFARF